MNSPELGHERLDRAACAAHADSLVHVSAATMAQLHRRRHAALNGAPRQRWQLPVAAFASLVAVAAGFGVGLGMLDEAAVAPATPALAAASAEPGIETVLDDLDQAPDFYVWLASGDADLIAME